MDMQYRRLGKSGLQVSALSFGSWVSFSNQLEVDAAEVLTGASRVEQVHDNLQALEVAEMLTDDLMAEFEEVLDNKPEPIGFQ